MGATYTRQSTFTDGDVIDSDIFNNEFDQLLAAFASSTGHTHDGTAGEGGPITGLITDGIVFGTNKPASSARPRIIASRNVKFKSSSPPLVDEYFIV